MTVDEEFSKAVPCTYKGREYQVRDNGAILRFPPKKGSSSKYDGRWTFGIKDSKTGYMFLSSSIRVHQVVCTAFHGPAPLPNMVVDHIDTNRCNNRPENLRWVTRLENALTNEYTKKKIVYLCGSIEAFLENPSILRSKALPPNIDWMRTVTKAEADACKKHLDELSTKETVNESLGNGLGDWVFQTGNSYSMIPNNRFVHQDYPRTELAGYCQKQYSEPMWECRVLNHSEESLFPCSPSTSVESQDVIGEYHRLLQTGADFLISRYYKLIVVKVLSIDNGNQLRVLSKRPNGEKAVWYIFDIWTNGNILFHQKMATFSLLKEQKAYAALNEISTDGHKTNDPGRTYYCVREKGIIRIKSGTQNNE